MTHTTPNITVYTQANCRQCRATQRHLDKAEVPYLLIDLDGLDEAREHVKDLGHMQAPVVVASIRGRQRDWSGFNPDMLNEYIESERDERYGASA